MDKHTKSLLITILGIVLMSFESLFIKVSSIDAFTFLFYASIFLFLSTNLTLIVKYKKRYFPLFKQEAKMIIVCGLFFAISNLSFIQALKDTSVANAMLIFSSVPIFSAFYLYVLYKIKTRKNTYISFVFIFIGLLIIFSSDLGKDLAALGNIFALLCACMYSLGYVLLSKHTKIDIYMVFCLSGFFGAIISSFFINSVQIDTNNLYLVILTGFLFVPTSRALIGIGVKNLEATEISLLAVLETIVAPILAWLFLANTPSRAAFIGGFIILTTLIINSLFSIKANKNKIK